MGEIRLGDLVTLEETGEFGIVSGRTENGWLVDLADGSLAVTWALYRVIRA